MMFDYAASAELFMPKRKRGARQPLSYRRFATAAEAIRFAVEEFPSVRTLGAWMQVPFGEQTSVRTSGRFCKAVSQRCNAEPGCARKRHWILAQAKFYKRTERPFELMLYVKTSVLGQEQTSWGWCESYRELEAGAGGISFAAVRISSLAAR